MNWFFRIAAIAAATFALSTGASAGLVDFAEHAKGNEHGVADGTTENVDGFLIEFSGTGGSAYFDHSDNVLYDTAGLGVCTVLDSGDQCNPSSDDNLTIGESVTIIFDFIVELTSIVFSDEFHDPVDPTETLMIDGTEMTFAAASAATFTGTTFTFGYGTESPDQYYISAMNVERVTVPAPAALGLIGFGLAGIGVARRRRS